MLLSTFFFSLVNLTVKALKLEGLSAPELVFWRSLTALLMTAPLMVYAGASFIGRRKLLLLVRGLLGFVGLSIFFYNLQHLKLFEATVLVYTNPIFAALLAPLILRERPSRAQLLITLASFIGVVLVATPSTTGFRVWLEIFSGNSSMRELFPYLLGLYGGLNAGVAYLVVRLLSRTEHTLTIVWYFPLVSLPLSLPNRVVPGFDYQFVGPHTMTALGGILAIGLFTTLAQIYLTRGLRREEGAQATAMNYTALIFNALWGFLFFGEVPAWWTVLGALIIAASVYAIARLRAAEPTPATVQV